MTKRITEKQHQKIINKIKLLMSLDARGVLENEEVRKYLRSAYSCAHCKKERYKDTPSGRKICIPSHVQPLASWCLKWMERKNWKNVKKEKKK